MMSALQTVTTAPMTIAELRRSCGRRKIRRCGCGTVVRDNQISAENYALPTIVSGVIELAIFEPPGPAIVDCRSDVSPPLR